jgi:23S rRNA pseudouridine1911/1915/1917 synthase
MRDPSGWSSAKSSRAGPPPAPRTRWTATATSATVPATISTPIPTTRALSARTDPPPPPDAAAETFAATAGPEAAGQRADRFLADAIGSLSRSRVKALIAEGRATRDGGPLASASEPVRAGSRYALSVPPPVSALPLPQDIPLAVLHEDADLIVLDKPAGLVVHPAPGNQDGTLVNALLAHAGDDLPGIGGEKRPGIVHRLDKDTSGVMVVAKTERAHRALSLAFAERDLDREYLALVWGLPEPPQGEVDAPIGRHPADRKRMAVLTGTDAERRGKTALTRYRTERAWGGAACALLRCRLLTGRTHQIRVHLAHAGHPLVGDPVYLRRVPAAARLLPQPGRDVLLAFPRQALHAATLGFRHPVTGQALHFSTPPPPDLAALLALLDCDGE